MTHVLAIDQGTTSSRAIVFDAGLEPRRRGAGGVPPALPALGLGRARPRRHLVDASPPPAAAPSSAPASLPGRPRRDRHHQPARDDARLGARHRPPARPRHRLAGPPHLRALRRAPRGRPRGRSSPRAPASSSTPTSPAPSSSGSSTPTRGRARGARRGELLFGTVDSYLIWRLTGGARPRHRRHQRRPDAALRHPHGRLGPRHLRPPRHPPRDAARGPRLRRRLRRHPPRPLRRPPRSRSSASPATSRRRPSARPASRRGC